LAAEISEIQIQQTNISKKIYLINTLKLWYLFAGRQFHVLCSEKVFENFYEYVYSPNKAAQNTQ